MNRLNIILALLIATVTLSACSMFTQSNQENRFGLTPDQTSAQDRARIHTELGAGYYSRGQYAIALDELKQALSANDRYAPAYDMRGLVYMALAENKKAEESFLRALDLSPEQPEIHNNYGWFLCSRNRLDAAMSQFNIALNNPLYTSPGSALTNAGICSLKANKTALAQAYFERSLKFDPNQAQALYELANIYYHQGQLAQARTLISRFFEYNEPTAQALWLGIRLARKQNDHDTEASYALLLRNRFADAPETQLLLQGKYD